MPETEGIPYVQTEGNKYNGKIIIKELAELWLKDIKNVMRLSSYALYQSYTEKYISPYIGGMAADVFNADILSKLLGRFYTDGKGNRNTLSQYTVYLLESMVRSMFRYGAEQGLVPEINFGKAEFITVKKNEAIPLTELEIQRLLLKAGEQGTDLLLQICLPLYAGLTLSELCGLKWGDINFKTGEINIHRNLVRIQQHMLSNNTENTGTKEMAAKMNTAMAECELSENMCRKFIMPKKLAGMLEKAKYTKKPDVENYVAGLHRKVGRKRSASMPADAPDGRTLQYRLKTAGRKAGIDGLTFKILRDTFAVMCLQAGGDVYSLAYIMGTGVPAVCDRYGQWMLKTDEFLKNIG